MRFIVLDIWGDYGHFRKFFTTSSPLTFSFPPPPTIAGMLGAVYGTDKARNEHLTLFSPESCTLSIQIRKPHKKVRMGLNLIDTKRVARGIPKKNLSPYHKGFGRTQIRTEFVREPCYRIYLSHRDPAVQGRLRGLLAAHRSIFTLSLGLSELLANFEYVGELEARERESPEPVEIATPVLQTQLAGQDGIMPEPEKRYFKERIPVVMTPERIVTHYEDVIYEATGKCMNARLKVPYYELENGVNITSLWPGVASGENP